MKRWRRASKAIASAAVRNGAPSRRRGNSQKRLSACGDGPVLVDCLTLWLSNLMLAEANVEEETAQLEETLAATKGPLVLVANEVGSGIVPSYPLGRRFRDMQGILNQRMAARAERVILMVAGLPLALKGTL